MASMRATAQRRLLLLHPGHEGAVALGIGGVLVAGEEFDAPGDDGFQRLARLERHHLLAAGAGQRLLDARAVVRRLSTPLEGRLVVLDLHVVELDGAQQRLTPERHPAALPGVAPAGSASRRP